MCSESFDDLDIGTSSGAAMHLSSLPVFAFLSVQMRLKPVMNFNKGAEQTIDISNAEEPDENTGIRMDDQQSSIITWTAERKSRSGKIMQKTKPGETNFGDLG